MPFSAEQTARRHRLRAEILRRVEGGETVAAICRGPGMPVHATVCGWALQAPDFGALLADAQRRAAYRRRYAFDEVKGRAFLSRLAAGEALRDLVRDPALPGPAALRHWRATQGEFGAEVRRLIRAQRVERVGRLRRAAIDRRPPWTEAEGDRVLLLVGRGGAIRRLHLTDPALTERTIARWRRESPQFAADLRANIKMGRSARQQARAHATLEALCERIVEGGSINSLAGQDGLPSRETLGRWIARYPRFAEEVAEACEERKHWYLDQLMEIAERTAVLGVKEAKRRMAPVSRRLGQLSRRPGKRWRAPGST